MQESKAMNSDRSTFKPAASYVAVFPGDGDDTPCITPLREQQWLVNRFGDKAGYDIVLEFEDVVTVEGLHRRPGFTALIAAARADNPAIMAIIVAQLDRFSQVAAERIMYQNQLEAFGIELVEAMPHDL